MIRKIFIASALLPAVIAFAQQYGGMWMPTELTKKK